MPRPTLDDSFRSGPPRRSPEEYHGWMTAEECRFILWGLKERWSAARIGRALGVNEATVRRTWGQWLVSFPETCSLREDVVPEVVPVGQALTTARPITEHQDVTSTT